MFWKQLGFISCCVWFQVQCFMHCWSVVICCFRLNFGLDYKGNVCGDRHGDRDLRELELRYWLNPNQVYQSGVKGTKFELSNARSICLMDCPTPIDDSLNWVCDYPEGDVRISLDDWIDRNYDYFSDLTPELRNTSLQLQGPCYPVIFPSVNGTLLWCIFMYSIIYPPSLTPEKLFQRLLSFSTLCQFIGPASLLLVHRMPLWSIGRKWVG